MIVTPKDERIKAIQLIEQKHAFILIAYSYELNKTNVVMSYSEDESDEKSYDAMIIMANRCMQCHSELSNE